MNTNLTQDEKKLLLALARQALVEGVSGKMLKPLNLGALPENLRLPGASFVTLMHKGELRGCVGALEAYQPLAEDVRMHTLAAAQHDYRFPPVTILEVPFIQIEISRLSPAQPLDYENSSELPSRLCPGLDGVILYDDVRRATFLPQVWQKLPDPVQFLDSLCLKMGAEPGLWRYKKLRVFTYQVEEFQEPAEA
ncbi:MAG: AmmeMemoRadiSam system protein A [Anaerolineales bacterium]